MSTIKMKITAGIIVCSLLSAVILGSVSIVNSTSIADANAMEKNAVNQSAAN